MSKTAQWIGGILFFLLVIDAGYLLLHPPTSSPSLTLISNATYRCDANATFSAAFYQGAAPEPKPGEPPVPTGSVTLTFADGSTKMLQQTISADGGRYANDDESFVFWDKGASAMVLENGQQMNFRNCARTSLMPAQNS